MKQNYPEQERSDRIIGDLSTLSHIVLRQLSVSVSEDGRRRALNFLQKEIISTSAYPDVSFHDPDLWTDAKGRSHARYLHGFLFLTDWVGTILVDEHQHQAKAAVAKIINSWSAANGGFPGSNKMAYHDETTAQRLTNLLRIATVTTDDALLTDFLRPLMDSTALLLADNEFHSPGNNHGMFQDLALLYYSVLAEWRPQAERVRFLMLSLARLKNYFNICFTSEGVHIENTPSYHLMVCRNLAFVHAVTDAAHHPDARDYATLLAKAEKYATHALMPNGLYPPISDTTQRRVDGEANRRVFSSPEFWFAASRGRNGTPPKERILALPESGYFIYRSSWEDPDATYAFFSAAYNSGYHKHSDDLSLFLRSSGIDLLAESGPYSYDYKDPLSRYAYSQFSHNSLVVDGKSLPRTDNKASAVTLKVENQSGTGIVVQGTNGRYKDTIHRRTLEVDESSGSPRFEITDQITSATEHSYQLLWNLGPKVSVVIHGQGFELFRGSKKLMDLRFEANVPTKITVRKGVGGPKPMGWTFPDFGQSVPSHVVSVNFSGKSAEVKTSIRLRDFLYNDRGIRHENGWRRYKGKVPVNYLLTAPDGPINKLVVCFSAIHAKGDFTYNYKSTVDKSGAAALYILDDFGDQGSYYYSNHRSTDILQSVQSLLREIVDQHGISPTDVAMIGSSKGGAAALIHGLSFGAARIIVGAPQTRIGSFLRKPHPNILEFMAGGVSDDDVTYLDSIIPELMRKAAVPSAVSVLVGDADHHLARHVLPLLEDARDSLVEIHPTVLPGYKHADIGKIFRLFLRANLEQWMAGKTAEALPYELDVDRNAISLRVFSPKNSLHAFRLYSGSEMVDSRTYSDESTCIFEELPAGHYRIRIFTRDSLGSNTAFTTRRVSIV